MSNERTFFRCSKCGNFVAMIENSGVPMICCGQPMHELAVNTEEAAHEKHIPALSRESDHISVAVGSTVHPMTEEHHIAWIVAAQGPKTQFVRLEHTAEPKACFAVDAGSCKVYAYCNLHGLWAAEI